MHTLIQDLRFGARMLVKNPGFTLISIFTLALGIGANTAIFSVVNAVLLKPLPFRQAEQIVRLRSLLLTEGENLPGQAGWKPADRLLRRANVAEKPGDDEGGSADRFACRMKGFSPHFT